MQVIDGMHRLSAARLRGERTVAVRFFEGSDKEAFVEAVRANTTHGKPLVLAEREAAAVKILDSHPDWSDRAIADVCGLSPKTIAGVRRRSTDGVQCDARVGRDGRVRPVDTVKGRQRAAEVFRERPNATLREVGRIAGVSPGTARDVRDRVRQGVTPLPPRQQLQHPSLAEPLPPPSHSDLERDTALNSNDDGRSLVAWLAERTLERSEWEGFVDQVPLSRLYVVAEVARTRAGCWIEFAEALESRARRR
jgi:hypothetical protein